jgi:hypothetical protein
MGPSSDDGHEEISLNDFEPADCEELPTQNSEIVKSSATPDMF